MNRQKVKLFLCIMLIGLIAAFAGGRQPTAKAVTGVQSPVNPNVVLQEEFQGWGTSLAWWADVVGGWSEPERSQIMDYLFSDSFTIAGQTVQGINLNIARYNLGASEPGVSYEVVDPHLPPRNGAWIDSLIQADGSYDWTVDANQRWVLEQAALRGADTFEIFANSPPWWMTHSGHPAGRYSRNSSQGCQHSNLRGDMHDEFAAYLATVVERFATVGVDGPGSTPITFKTIEPFNEPSNGWWCWGNNQEGTYLTGAEQSSMIDQIQSALDARGLTTELAATDSNNYWLVNSEYWALTESARNKLDQINAHGYAGSDPEPIRRVAEARDMRFWQSEWGPADWGGYSITSDLDSALELATRVTNDLTFVEANGWLYWQAVEDNTRGSGPGYWGLIQATLDGSAQSFQAKKQFYALGQYSKFIRPGYLIIDSGSGKTVAGFDPAGNTLVLVTHNDSAEAIPYTYDLSRFRANGASAQVWRTSDTENLAQLPAIPVSNGALSAIIEPNSVTTFVISPARYNAPGTTAELINDSDPNFSFSGSWSESSYSGGAVGAYGLWDQDEHASQSTNATASYAFFGTKVTLFGTLADSSGKVALSIDGGAETIVDLGYPVRLDGVMVWESPELPSGLHTVKMRITGEAGSLGGKWGSIDRVVVENAGWTACANEGQTCTFSGTAEVRYGAKGLYTRGVFTGGAVCDDATFGDPMPGAAKACTYRNVSTTSLIALHSHKCAAVSGSSTSPGADVVQWRCLGSAEQSWLLEASTDGYRLKPSHAPTQCMDVSGASSSNGADVVQWNCGSAANQQWDFVYVRDGYYEVRPNHTSNKCLDVAGESGSSGANVDQWACDGYPHLLWALAVPAGANNAPLAAADSPTTAEDTAATIDVLANDSDADGHALTITGVTQPAHGAAVNNGDDVTYTPDANYNGPDSFEYTISDGNGGSATATVAVTVSAVNDDPTAADDAQSTAEDTPVTIAVLANDSDLDGDALAVGGVTQPANGSVVNNGTNVTYTPNANYNGGDSFTYTLSDGNGGSATAMVAVTISAVNDDPTAAADAQSTPEDTPVTIAVLANDSDADGDALTISSVTDPAHGAAVNNGGNVTYTPDAGYSGPDSFEYTISDGQGGMDTATVNVTVSNVNVAPLAANDSAATDEDTPVTIAVLANDSDADGDALTVSSVTDPAHGAAVNNGGNVTYTPDAGYSGPDSFEYTISDGQGGTDTATVAVTVNPVQVGPTCNGLPATIVGTEGNNVINGTAGNDVIVGLGGNDTIKGQGGNDVICGGPGNDKLYGGAGDDTLVGEDGGDTLTGEKGNDTLLGGLGNDKLSGGVGNDDLSGEDGDDRLDGNGGNDTLSGGNGNDGLYAGSGNDALNGGDGDDRLEGSTGNDTLVGGLGADTLYGGAGSDALTGDEGNDLCDGDQGKDTAATCEVIRDIP